MDVESVLFFLIAGVAAASAILTVTRQNPVQSVLFLILNFFCLALLYLTLHAEFLAIIQILVYAGAIMVLFLFVIMLLNLADADSLRERSGPMRFVGITLALVVLGQLGFLLRGGDRQPRSPLPDGFGSAERFGGTLFRDYLVPFEMTSILLLAALVGVIILARKQPTDTP